MDITRSRRLPARIFIKSKTFVDLKKVKIRRKAEKHKKFQLKPWETDDAADDGIVGWTKRQNLLESKKDIPSKIFQISKKRPAVLDADYYISVNHKCPSIEDADLFHRESLHSVHKPKQKPVQVEETSVKLKYTKSKVITPAGYEDKEEVDESKELNRSSIESYRESKHSDSVNDKTRDNAEAQTKAQLERSNTYMKIKRLLKFSKNDRRNVKADEEEDEGYSSKTSSAEIKHGVESDGEDVDNNVNSLRPELQRMYSSMVDLSELPSQDAKIVEDGAHGRVKFSYTHQPTILQLPDPDIKLAHDSLRIEKRIESENSNWSYAKLKRNKELNRCYKPEMIQPAEESTVYNIDNMKPVTLVLRKISIQNTDHMNPQVSQWSSSSPEHAQNALSNNLGLGSNPASRAGSVNQNECSNMPRPDSAVSGSPGSPVPGRGTQRNVSPQCNTSRSMTSQRKCATVTRASSAVSQRELRGSVHRGNVRDVRVVSDNTPKEPMWNHQYSYVNEIDSQATSYSIGDLLPAVDKNIYSSHAAISDYVQNETDTPRDEMTTTEILDMNKNAIDDGYILLKKGMDMLTGSTEKLKNKKKTLPTLGPPPFRPNQTRHPLMRNMTVIVNSKQGSGSTSSSVGSGTRNYGLKCSSDKGPRQIVDEDVQTQKKLKEAFSQFYKNRPKEIGKEFRRMQTMWKT
ncbi:hypothetical protein ACF0H5_005143 [Mactra antiquata]